MSESLDLELPSFRLDGRLAVVTGASEGIGRAAALGYARAGAEIVLVSRRRDKLLEVRRSIQAAGGQAHVVCADVGRLADIQVLASSVAQLLQDRALHLILLNCAGFALTKPAMDVTEDDFDQVLAVHVKGTFFCCQSLARLMIDRGYGKMINLSSTWSTTTDMGKSVYGLAKAAVSHLTTALSAEWAPLGVRVNAIAPTATLTDNTKHNFEQRPDRADRILHRIKLGRFAVPADLLGAAIFLASPASDFVTGHTLFVDGGWQGGL